MANATKWRVIRRDYYVEPAPEGTWQHHSQSYTPGISGTTTESIEDIREWDAAQVGLWKDELDEQDADYYDVSNYYLQILQDGKWVDVKLLEPVVILPDYAECDSRGEDENPTYREVLDRARSHFGDTELAREAASMYPGDFI